MSDLLIFKSYIAAQR